jgi:hypothetical protein
MTPILLTELDLAIHDASPTAHIDDTVNEFLITMFNLNEFQ